MEYRGGTILAIDQNTKSGIAEGVPGGVPLLSTQVFRRDETDRVEDIYERATFFFADRFRTNPPGLVVIEKVVAPSAARGFTNHDTTMLTIGIYAVICGIVKCKGIPLHTVAVQTWRAALLGKGGGRLPSDVAKRETIKVCRRLGWEPEDNNAADAAGIWLWACGQVAPETVRTSKPSLFAEAS